jgi:hypothetical protein
MLRLWLAMGVGVAALMASGVVASMAKAQAGGDPAAVITAYEMARNRRDLDAAVSYFADDATISQRTTTFSGKEEIRKFLEGVSTRSRFVVVSDRRTSGTHVSWTERSGSQGPSPQPQPAQQGPANLANPGTNATRTGTTSTSSINSAATVNPFAVTVEAVVQDGKIRSLAYMAANQPARVDPALDGRAQLPASVGLGAVMVVLLGIVAIASMGLRRSTRPSTLQGRLMQDLQGWSAARQ